MNWEKLTSSEFRAAVKKAAGVCVVPFGVIEAHGDHLPLGQDALNVHAIATAAAELEPAIVMPPYYWGMNTHAKCEPGSVAIRHDLLLPLLESLCMEIARNGLNKIVFFNGHGGNVSLLSYMAQKMLDEPKPYMVYILGTWNGDAKHKVTHPELYQAKYDGHGGENETSLMMAEYPELVKGQPGDYGLPLRREDSWRELGIETPTSWYADHPHMLSADNTPCTREKGERLLKLQAEYLAEVIRKVKNDNTPIELYREFLERCDNPNQK